MTGDTRGAEAKGTDIVLNDLKDKAADARGAEAADKGAEGADKAAEAAVFFKSKASWIILSFILLVKSRDTTGAEGADM